MLGLLLPDRERWASEGDSSTKLRSISTIWVMSPFLVGEAQTPEASTLFLLVLYNVAMKEVTLDRSMSSAFAFVTRCSGLSS